MLDETLEIFRNVPIPVWLFLSLLCVSTQLGSVNGVHDFTVYRMQHYDIHGTPLGSRSAVVNMEARSVSTSMLNRKCVVLRWTNLTIELFTDVISRGVGAILILLPINWKHEDKSIVNEWMELENKLLSKEVPISVYFTVETDYLNEVYTKLNDSSKDSTASAALISSVIGQGYTLLADAVEPVPVDAPEVVTIIGKLIGEGYDPELPTVVLLAHYDSFGIVPGLSYSSDSGGSGVATILELARIFSKLYSNPVHRPKYNLLFVLTGGGKLNYFGSKYFIEDMLEDSDSFLLTDADYVLCLDSLAGGSQLYVHVSRPPKETTRSFNLLELMNVSSNYIDGFNEVTLKHKKIRIGDEILAWEHERFSLKRIPAVTLSHFEHHQDLHRKSMFHTSSDIDILYRNVQLLAETIGRHIYGIKDDNSTSLWLSDNLGVHKDYLRAWLDKLSATPRSSQVLTKDNPFLLSLGQTLAQYVHEVSTFTHKPDKNDPEFVLYSQMETIMHSYSVKPAVFDLVLALCIVVYVTGVYFFITYFSVINDTVVHLTKRRFKTD